MKIAILTSGILPVPAVQGGAVENLIDYYLEYNNQHYLHDITVYSINNEKAVYHPALQSEVNHYRFIDVSSLGAKICKNLRHLFSKDGYYHYSIEYYFEQALKQITGHNYDLIIIENRPGYALKLKKKTDTQLVYHLHNEKLTIQDPLYQEIYQAATRIITVSDYIKKCVQLINPNDTKTLTVHNGIDLQAFSYQQNLNQHVATEPRNDDFVMIFSGRITKEKGIMELIEAMNILKDYNNIKLLVIGSSFFGNANHKNEFIQQLKTKAIPLGERIIFTGFIPYNQMPDYLQLADIAVIPSVWDDPFPTTVLEAQAMGLPVISTRRGGIPEEVTPETAILLDTDNHFVENLANAILDLYEHPEKRKAMSEAAKKHSQLFSKERYAREFFEALESIK